MNNFADKNNPLMPDHIGHREYDVDGNKVLTTSDERDTLRSIVLPPVHEYDLTFSPK